MLLTPTYHVFDMYQPFMEAVPYPAQVKGPTYSLGKQSMAMVDVSAARAKNGKTVLALVNSDPNKPARVVTNLTGTAKGPDTRPPRRWTRIIRSMRRIACAPRRIGSKTEGGKLAFDLPAKSVAVVTLD